VLIIDGGQSQPQSDEIMVSVCCAVYNHAPFLRECFDGFVNQKTNFRFEVLINDDASTDGSQAIIREYKKKYPDIIKPILHNANQWSKGKSPFFDYNLPRVQGKYIALCEGDDYWIDMEKLQKQVNFLEAHPGYTVCFADTVNHHQDGSVPDFNYPDWTTDFTIETLLTANFINTCSVMYRAVDYSNLSANKVMPGDWYLHLYHARQGKIGHLPEPMSVYRINRSSLWFHAAKKRSEEYYRQFLLSSIRFSLEVSDLFPEAKYQTIFLEGGHWGQYNIGGIAYNAAEHLGDSAYQMLFEVDDALIFAQLLKQICTQFHYQVDRRNEAETAVNTAIQKNNMLEAKLSYSNERAEALETSLSYSNEQVEALRTELNYNKDRVQTLDCEVSKKDKQIAEYIEGYDDMHRRIRDAANKEMESHLEILKYQAIVADYEGKLSARLEDIEKLTQSTSWRITEPFRKISGLFRRVG
jgi:glycosyltransferase involved in cell wall biosynthesis